MESHEIFGEVEWGGVLLVRLFFTIKMDIYLFLVSRLSSPFLKRKLM